MNTQAEGGAMECSLTERLDVLRYAIHTTRAGKWTRTRFVSLALLEARQKLHSAEAQIAEGYAEGHGFVAKSDWQRFFEGIQQSASKVCRTAPRFGVLLEGVLCDAVWCLPMGWGLAVVQAETTSEERARLRATGITPVYVSLSSLGDSPKLIEPENTQWGDPIEKWLIRGGFFYFWEIWGHKEVSFGQVVRGLAAMESAIPSLCGIFGANHQGYRGDAPCMRVQDGRWKGVEDVQGALVSSGYMALGQEGCASAQRRAHAMAGGRP